MNWLNRCNLPRFAASRLAISWLLLVIASWHSLAHAQSENQSEFSPLDNLITLVYGKQIVALLHDDQIDVLEKKAQLKLLIPDERIKQSPYYAFAYYRLCHDIALSQGEPQQALDCVVAMDNLAVKFAASWLQGEAKMWQATFAAQRGEFDQGISLVDQSIAIAKESDYLHLLARAYNTKAALYYFQDQFYLALEYYLQALDIFLKDPQDKYVSKVLSNIAIIYVDLEEWQQAWHANNRAMEHVKIHGGSDSQLSAFNNNAAYILERQGRVAESEPYLIDAEKHADMSGNLRLQLNTMTSWAHYYLETEQHQQAIDVATRCIAQGDANQFPLFEADCSRIMAKSLVRLGQVDAAFIALENAEQHYQKIGTRAGLADTFNTYALAYEVLGNFQQALVYQRQANEEDKALLFDSRAKMIFNLSQRYQDKFKQQELALLKAKSEAQAARLNEQLLREKLLFFAILVAIGLIIYSLRKRYWLESSNKSLQDTNTELFRQSNVDPLTGLYNRRFLLDHIEKLANNQQHSGSRLAIGLIDIDFFKQVNDGYGHEAGDIVLAHIANLLSANIRTGDVAVRWGGEEFVLLLNFEAATIEVSDIQAHFERVRQAVEGTKITAGEHILSVTISIGVSPLINNQDISTHWHSALACADKALYSAKLSGRNQVQLHPN
ncbi:diguanylate cyclase [Shewanella waksmanii]|uniref:diguanylate cyclase n=1 Tax=Shewanella waksmanii TaxID=213783 RepID=UPI003734E83D